MQASNEALDTSGIPLGERAQRSILDHVMAVGDAAETSYLEVKSEIDLESKEGIVKVAKFLLGTANRPPRISGNHFQGYSVMVLGAELGAARGVPKGLEPHDLENRLEPYLGSDFPGYEIGRLTVSPSTEVLFIVGLPPLEGQTIFTCRKSFSGSRSSDSIEDGAIYVRGQSNTRPARWGEVAGLLERAAGATAKRSIDLKVSTIGSINRVLNLDEDLEILYDFREQNFKDSGNRRPPSVFGANLIPSLTHLQPSVGESRGEAYARWKRDKNANIEAGRIHLLGTSLNGISFCLESRGRFIRRPQVVLAFRRCELYEFLYTEDGDIDKLAPPVIKPSSLFGYEFDSSMLAPMRNEYPVSGMNVDYDAQITLTPESLRPDTPWTTSATDFVMCARDLSAEVVHVDWVLTEDNNDDRINGSFEVQLPEPKAARDLIRSIVQ